MWFPPGVLSGILRHLQDPSQNSQHPKCVPITDQGCAFRLVCREWRACFDEELRVLQPRLPPTPRGGRVRFSGVTTLCFCRYPRPWLLGNDTLCATMETLLDPAKLRHVCMCVCRYVTDDGLTHAFASCTGLTRLVLPHCTGVTSAGVASLVRHNTGLIELNIDTVASRTQSGGWPNFPVVLSALTHLNVSHSTTLDSEGIRTFTGSLPNLTRLDMNGCERLDDDLDIYNALGPLTRLRYLDVDRHRRTTGDADAGLPTSAAKHLFFPALTHVHLKGRNTLLQLLSFCSGCYPRLVELGVQHLQSDFAYDRLTSLSTLRARHCAGPHLSVSMTALTDLQLEGITVFDDTFGCMPNLQRIELFESQIKTSESSSTPGFFLPRNTLACLTHLVLTRCECYVDLTCWLLDLPSLRVVALPVDGKAADLTFATLGCIKTLESISIERIFRSPPPLRITDVAIAQLAGLDRLEELIVRTKSTALTKEGLHRALGHLSRLSLSRRLFVVDVTHSAKKLFELNVLRVYDTIF